MPTAIRCEFRVQSWKASSFSFIHLIHFDVQRRCIVCYFRRNRLLCCSQKVVGVAGRRQQKSCHWPIITVIISSLFSFWTTADNPRAGFFQRQSTSDRDGRALFLILSIYSFINPLSVCLCVFHISHRLSTEIMSWPDPFNIWTESIIVINWLGCNHSGYVLIVDISVNYC